MCFKYVTFSCRVVLTRDPRPYSKWIEEQYSQPHFCAMIQQTVHLEFV